MCGGRGSRMGNLTKSRPKPLVKVAGRPLLEYKLREYKSQGFNNFIFCTGYMANKMKQEINKMGYDGIFSNIGEDAGILERIHTVRKYINDSTIISYGDTFGQIDFKDLVFNHKKSNALITIVITSIKHPFGLVNFDSNSNIISFDEKPLLNHYIGYAVIEPNIFDKIPNRFLVEPDGEGLVKSIKYLINLDLANTYKFGGLQVTINTNSDLKKATKKIGNYYTIND